MKRSQIALARGAWGDLATQDGVLVAKDQKFSFLRDIAARDGGQGAEEFTGDPVSDGDQHPTMLSKLEERRGCYVLIAQIRINEPRRCGAQPGRSRGA